MIVDICLYFQVYFANKAKEKAPSLIYLQITFDINSHHRKSNDKVDGPQRNSQYTRGDLDKCAGTGGGAAIIEKTHKQRQ